MASIRTPSTFRLHTLPSQLPDRVARSEERGRHSISRGMSDRLFVDLEQSVVVGLRRVELFEVAPSAASESNKFIGMAQGPFHLVGQRSCVARPKVQTVVPL